VVVDPVRKRQMAGEDLPVIVVEQQIAHFAEQLTREVMAKRLEAARAPGELSPSPRETY
jgi:hypothetical protein